MTAYFTDRALLPGGWARAVRIEVDPSGAIAAVTDGADPEGAERLAGPVVPGVPNLHSHAFQRAMAGLAERAGVDGPSIGAGLWRGAVAGGNQALGRDAGRIEAGRRADLVVLDPSCPALHGRDGDLLLDAAVFAGNVNPVRDVMVGGAWAVRDARHPLEDEVAAAWRAAVDRLAD